MIAKAKQMNNEIIVATKNNVIIASNTPELFYL